MLGGIVVGGSVWILRWFTSCFALDMAFGISHLTTYDGGCGENKIRLM